nr:tetratricopeptide repeat protein [bacterium]
MLHSKTKNKHFVLAFSIAVVLVGSFTLRYDKLSWGIPVDEVKPTRTPITPELAEEPSYYLRRGQYNEVIQKCSQLLAKDPKSQVYGLLSVAYAGLEQLDKASEAMQKAKAAGESNASLIHISQAMMHRARGQYDAAITESRKAINLAAKNPLAYATLGMAYLGKKEQEKATEYLKKAIEIEPEYAHGHTALGANYLIQKKIREAFMEYKQATEIDPKDYRPHMGLGTIYTGMGMYYNAVNEYKTVLSLNPSSLSARTQLSALYLQLGKYDDAITEAKEVLRADSQSAQAYFILSRAYSFKNQFDVAIENLNQLLSLQPDSFEGNYLLGLSLMANVALSPRETPTSPPKNKDDFKSARQRFQKAEQINSKQADTAIAIFHIDNLPDSNPLKHIWLEMEAIQHLAWSLPYDLAVPHLNLPGGYNETGSDFFIDDLAPFGDRYRENDWWRIEQNPPWEEIVLDFFVWPGEEVYVDNFHIAGEYVYADNFHVATEGSEPIPEPSPILLLGCGALGL